MNRLQIATVVTFAIAVLVRATQFAYRTYRKKKDQGVRRAQVEHRIKRDNYQKGLAVDVLEERLRKELDIITQNHTGAESLRRARGTVESVYYTWVSDHMHLFHITENCVRIVAVRNGYFQFELPDELKQFTKGKRK